MSTDGAEKHFTDIYEREVDALFRFSLLRISDRDKAIEITQETFARLWQSIALGREIMNPRAFLYRTARNLIIDWYRKHKSLSLENLLNKNRDEDRGLNVVDEFAERSIEINAEAKQVLLMLEKLEEQYREVIYFRYIEDLSPQEIAEILNLNANVVSIRITRGMEMLRKLMNIEK